MAVLEAIEGLKPGQLYPLEGESAVLGRHPACDIVLESGSVSRQHARIVNVAGNFYIEDLHSRNGTLLNGRPVTQRQILADSDKVDICELKFLFHRAVGESESAASGGIGPAGSRRQPADEAMMIDDDRPVHESTFTSKVDVSTGLRLDLNTAAKLKALVGISQNLGRALSVAEVLPKLLDSLFAIFPQADRGFIVLEDPWTHRLLPKAVKYRRPAQGENVRISRTILSRVMASKEAILSADAAVDTRFDMAESIVDYPIHSMICAPLLNRDGQPLGVIQLVSLDPRNRFQRDDLDLLVSVACQAAFAVENAQLHEAALQDQALRRELDVAHEVQRGFLPSAAPRIPEYEFFEFYEPANQLGGDYYDYIELPGGRLAVVVADVSGKGVSASLLMAKLSAETRFCLASEPEPAQAMARLNRLFCESAWDDRFVTMALALLDPRRHEVLILNAGHLPPLWRRGPGRVEPVAGPESGLPLGVEQAVDYVPHLLRLAPGESLIMYTDGITEAMNQRDDLYGSARLLRMSAAEADGVARLGRRILDDVRVFVGARPQSDDMCLACFGRAKV
jgi:serine phosphatase RsbU (regulator of sigma subunit)